MGIHNGENRIWDLGQSPGEHHTREGKKWTRFCSLKHFGSGQKSKTQTMRARTGNTKRDLQLDRRME